jgi:hypothetical protein
MTLRNRIYTGKNHPPYSGEAGSKRFYKDEFMKWDMANQKREASGRK